MEAATGCSVANWADGTALPGHGEPAFGEGRAGAVCETGSVLRRDGEIEAEIAALLLLSGAALDGPRGSVASLTQIASPRHLR